MLFKQLLLAASAAAMLVVPETTEPEDGVLRTLPVADKTYKAPEIAVAQSIEVPCPQCRGHDTQLKLDFTVEDEKRLLVNGFELYPNADPWQGDLNAAVVKGNGRTKDRRLGYGLAVRPEGMDESQKLEVIGLNLLVIEVGDRFVDGIPTVRVKLIKAVSGEILIGSIDIDATETSDAAQCQTMLCRIQSLIRHTWKGVKGHVKGMGCKGMRKHGHHGHKSHHHHGQKGGKETTNSEDGHRVHGYHGHRHRHHAWNVVKHVASYILLPVIMGITAGVGVAVLTMFLGTLVMRLVRFVKGERHEEEPKYVDRKISIIEFLNADEEKAGLMEHQEAPPQYEDDVSRN